MMIQRNASKDIVTIIDYVINIAHVHAHVHVHVINYGIERNFDLHLNTIQQTVNKL